MSSEQSIKNENTKINVSINDSELEKINRVDINKLLSNLRYKKKKENKENILLFGVVSSIVFITGIIASL
tara:strand:- start:538 stop:747 length:210 start_codon:yes stop_codon:yes gene_type:complete